MTADLEKMPIADEAALVASLGTREETNRQVRENKVRSGRREGTGPARGPGRSPFRRPGRPRPCRKRKRPSLKQSTRSTGCPSAKTAYFSTVISIRKGASTGEAIRACV